MAAGDVIVHVDDHSACANPTSPLHGVRVRPNDNECSPPIPSVHFVTSSKDDRPMTVDLGSVWGFEPHRIRLSVGVGGQKMASVNGSDGFDRINGWRRCIRNSLPPGSTLGSSPSLNDVHAVSTNATTKSPKNQCQPVTLDARARQ